MPDNGKGARWYWAVAASIILSAGLAGLGVVLAQSSALTLRARALSTTPPRDPESAVWGQLPALEVPLSGQQIVVPRGGGGIRSLQVRAAHDGKSLFLHLRWRDADRDEDVLAAERFTDAVAVQFPEKSVSFAQLCMGTLAEYINIWQWRAEREADLRKGFLDIDRRYGGMHWDYYPFGAGNRVFAPGRAAGNILSVPEPRTPVQSLIAGGIGSLAARPAEEQKVQGRGSWRSGFWQVVLSRELSSSAAHDFSISPGQATVIAFAVWDGSRGDRNGQKAVANWVNLLVEAK